MANWKKLKIKGLNKKSSLEDAAKLVLNYRINILSESVKKYFADESEENLHSVRISIRRVRYNMEIFSVCFDKKKFMIFYDLIENLQDLTGSVRDIDVLLQNMNSLISGEKLKVSKRVLEKFTQKRLHLKEDLTLSLMNYIHGEELQNFLKMIT
jgi:CHAD domain-containing protein